MPAVVLRARIKQLAIDPPSWISPTNVCELLNESVHAPNSSN